MAERWFLKLDGIVGESTDDAHKGEIDVESWSWGVTQSGGGAGGGGGGSGKATFSDFHFVSRISAASPLLIKACATGTHIKQAMLSGVRGTGKSKGGTFWKCQLSDVTVTSVQQSDGESVAPGEQFSLNYSKIAASYSPSSKTGKSGTAVTFTYDLKSAKQV